MHADGHFYALRHFLHKIAVDLCARNGGPRAGFYGLRRSDDF